jgi:hypothetical protein
VGMMFIGAALLGSLASLVVRFRRSQGDERQQMKWLVYAGAFTISAILVASPAAPVKVGGIVSDLALLALPSIPAAVGIAILRYRLYDIDVVINRTLVYGALSVLLSAVYVGGVALFRAVLPVGGGDLGVAVSTLGVAALFRPVRARVQSVIDRRFYRRKYDAEQTVEFFGRQLRDQSSLETVSADLLRTVSETMQPRAASLWLPGAPEAR